MHRVYLVAVFLLTLAAVTACGDTDDTGGGGGQPAPTAADTGESQDADEPLPVATQPDVNATVTSERDPAVSGTATPDPTETPVRATATTEQEASDDRPTVTPDDSDMPLGDY